MQKRKIVIFSFLSVLWMTLLWMILVHTRRAYAWDCVPPVADFTVPSGSVYCGDETTFTSTSSDDDSSISRYSWTGGGSPASGSGSTFTTKWCSEGDKTVKLTVWDNDDPDCCGGAPDCSDKSNWIEKTVTVLAVEITTVNSNVDIACVGSTVEFDADTDPADKYNCVRWVGGGDPYRGSGETFVTKWDTPGTKTVTAWGCGSNESKDVTIFGGEIQPQDGCPDYGKFLLLWNPASSSWPEYYNAPSGQPSGTTYKWEISSGASNAEIDGSDTGSSVSLKPLAEGDLTLKLTYTYEEHTCVETLDTAVQKPNQANSYVTCGNRNGYCSAGRRGAYRWVYYHIRDGANRPIPNARWDEWWHCSGVPPPSGCCWPERDGPALCDGSVPDHLEWNENKNCDNWGLLCSDRQTIKVSGWPVSGHFWDNNLYYYDKNYNGIAPFIKLSPHCTD